MTTTVQPFEQRIRRMTPVGAPPEQRADVDALFVALERMLKQSAKTPKSVRCKLVGPRGEELPLPESIFYVLERVCEVMARGDSITVVPVGKELTTQEAADMLSVSRQYLVRLVEEGRIPHRTTGKHRRLKIDDVLSFKAKRDRDRRAGVRELSRMTEDFGGYRLERTVPKGSVRKKKVKTR